MEIAQRTVAPGDDQRRLAEPGRSQALDRRMSGSTSGPAATKPGPS
jgi:hypothetical protein